jgi:hypothetical protein
MVFHLAFEVIMEQKILLWQHGWKKTKVCGGARIFGAGRVHSNLLV